MTLSIFIGEKRGFFGSLMSVFSKKKASRIEPSGSPAKAAEQPPQSENVALPNTNESDKPQQQQQAPPPQEVPQKPTVSTGKENNKKETTNPSPHKGGIIVEIDAFPSTPPNKPKSNKLRPTPGSGRKSNSPLVIDASNNNQSKEDKVFSEEELNQLYGMETGIKLNAKKWQNRKDALDVMRIQLSSRAEKRKENPDVDSDSDDMFIQSTLYVLKKTMEDPVLPVYLATLDLLKGFLDSHSNLMVFENVKDSILTVIKILIKKINNNNVRIVRESCSSLLVISRVSKINGIALISSTLTDEELPIKARLTVLRLIIPECEFKKNSGLTLPMVMGITVPSLEIADDKTRKVAVGVVVDCYNVKGEAIYNSLTSVKPALMKIIHRKIAEARGLTVTGSQLPPLSGQKMRPNTVNNALPPLYAGGLPPLNPLMNSNIVPQSNDRCTQSAPSSEMNNLNPNNNNNNNSGSPTQTSYKKNFDSLLDDQDEQLMDEILNM